MNRVAWAAVALALRWANATDDQTAYPVLERVEAELWKLNHPPRQKAAVMAFPNLGWDHSDWCDANGCRCGQCQCTGEPWCHPPRQERK